MRQVVVSGGEIRVVDVPTPALRPGAVLVRTSHSLISAGTESVSLGGGESLVVRALRRPELVGKVITYAQTHGVKSAVDLVRARPESPLGYSTSGVVLAVAPGVRFRVGDRVACAGAGWASHAAVNVVPQSLVTLLPDSVPFPDAAFGTLAAIALQGVRRCSPTLGEQVVVLGLGLLGQITAQLLRLSGAVVIGVDVRPDRVERCLSLHDGFTLADRDLVSGVRERLPRGADAVIVTAASKDDSLLDQACQATRRKGRIVLVGDVPISMARESLYKKEIDFLISTSYGPGRYDPEYEEKGHDYPLPYVRWTEGRNLEEVIRCLGTGALDVRRLVDGVHPVEEARAAYATLDSDSPSRPIGVLLDFHIDDPAPLTTALVAVRTPAPVTKVAVRVGVVGWGSYFRSTLQPLLAAHPGFQLASACARNGLTVRTAVAAGFARGTTDYQELLSDPEVDLVVVATRHDLHHAVARAAVEAGKAVFVEKPMTLTAADGRELAELVAARQAFLTVGFNRRFSPHVVRLREQLRRVAGPRTALYRVNAGPLPEGHWLLDPKEGGGRILGEGVHFFDLLAFLLGEPLAVRATGTRDETVATLEFAEGVGTVVYTGRGGPSAGKERLEVFAGGVTWILDDFRSLAVHGLKAEGTRTRVIDKGQRAQLENVYRALRGEEPLGVTATDGYRATWCAERALRSAEGSPEDGVPDGLGPVEA